MPETHTLDLLEFQGPFDLLLQLIERRELDITRVSLAALADQYLDLITRPGLIELPQLADYLVIASRLILIKSRLLLPRPESPVEQAEQDPGQALARQLREYRRYKQAAGSLRERELKNWRMLPRRAAPPRIELPPSNEIEGLSFNALFRALRRVLAANPALPAGRLAEPLSVSIQFHLARIRANIASSPQLRFAELVEMATSRVEIIVIFLAVLESIKRRILVARQDKTFGEIILERGAGGELAPVEEAASIEQDWA